MDTQHEVEAHCQTQQTHTRSRIKKKRKGSDTVNIGFSWCHVTVNATKKLLSKC